MVDIRSLCPPSASDPQAPLRLALYEPDIPQNAGTLMRLCACLGLPMDLIEPAGFDASDRNLRRAGLDYLHALRPERHLSFGHFEEWRRARAHRLVLATTRADVAHHHFRFSPGDILLLGRESAGVPDHVHEAADARLAIPLRPGLRSLNVAVAGGILVAEAMRQLDLFPPMATTGGLDVPSP
ncbi:tRNA (cytidine(34)-2'-O)-methyltransferase [Rhabdaerophilum sp.]|uniref:tRNA (cytidine(34)-2'-O)-methyltransferase n=1 Tax=Rhabdaerophilum sp. TaxID=2717341 RepID=UPI0038D44D1E